jgi:hypothetical protein
MGNVPYGEQPHSTEREMAGTAAQRALPHSDALPPKATEPKVSGSNPDGRA